MKRVVLIALAFLAIAAPCVADTDYVCLKACTDNGETSTSCLPKCTYDTPQSPSAVHPHASYVCMKSCVDSGVRAAACVPQCTDNSAPYTSVVAPSRAPPATHDQFKAPVESDAILAPHHTAPTTGSKDFNCMNLCMKGGLQYQLCDQRCGP